MVVRTTSSTNEVFIKESTSKVPESYGMMLILFNNKLIQFSREQIPDVPSNGSFIVITHVNAFFFIIYLHIVLNTK